MLIFPCFCMRVYNYQRSCPEIVGKIDCYYIPDLNVILCRRYFYVDTKMGFQCAPDVLETRLLDRQESIEDAKAVVAGKSEPKIKVRKLEFAASKLKQLIRTFKKREEAEANIKTGFDDVFGIIAPCAKYNPYAGWQQSVEKK